jgi:hypothetical protein
MTCDQRIELERTAREHRDLARYFREVFLVMSEGGLEALAEDRLHEAARHEVEAERCERLSRG